MNNTLVSFADSGQRSVWDFGVSMKESAEAYDLAPFIYAGDQRLGRAPMAIPFERLTFDQQEAYVTRAAIAVRLGDPIKAIALTEHAALGIIADVRRRIREQLLDPSTPEAQLTLPAWRAISRVSVLRALEYLGNTPRKKEGL